ncbi:MAG: N-acetyltransferase [Isosphaeraceae bacterium]|nr:N-acetyltransferase [Isosphaeraceae bacterium]
MKAECLAAVPVRWMIRDDVAAVLSIEGASFDRPWGAAELLSALRTEGVVGVVAESGGCVAGFMVYAPRGRAIDVLRLAVAPGARRRGVGRQLLGRLAARLAPAGRTRIALGVPERLLTAQLFLRACGFRAIAIERGEGGETREDVYVFERAWTPDPRLSAVGGGLGMDDPS